jgi:hypothetical protein
MSMPDLHIPDLNPADARVAGAVFEFVQFLLDDDANLTPAGNLTGAAKQKLRARVQELLADEEADPGDGAGGV